MEEGSTTMYETSLWDEDIVSTSREILEKFIRELRRVTNYVNIEDISQNANRTFEWFDYFRYLGSSVKEKPHMISCG